MAITLTELFTALNSTGLLAPAEAQAIEAGLPDKAAANPEELIRELVRTGKLTRYQAAAIFQGKAQTLVLGNYLVLDKIGAGGMGMVFRARHRKMDRIVAIKVLPKKSLSSPDAVERFQREVKAAARLAHANIVTAHDADEAGGVHFLVMEFVEGTDLSNLVKTQGPLPVAQAVSCILQAARGLQHAHAEGVIHRDIKPSNLLLDKRGRVKILDMGLARFSESETAASDSRDTATKSELTQTGSVMGTVDYMSPEQAIDTHQADHRADIYSLGCALYYLLAGRPPYSGETMMKRLVAHRETPIPSLRAARPEVPAELDEIVRRALAKKPEDRYQSMSDLIAALEKTTRGQAAASDGAAGRGRLPLVVGAVGIAAVLLVVLLIPWRHTTETAQINEPPAKESETTPPATEKPKAKSAAPEQPAEPENSPPVTKQPAEPTPPAVKAPTPATPAAEMKPADVPVADSVSPAVPAPPVTAPAPVATPETSPALAAAAAPAESADVAPEPSAADRLPIPAAAARDKALTVIKQIFADDYAAAKTPEGKSQLLQKLVAQADSTGDDPAARYVLLCEARDLAADLADTGAIDQTAVMLGTLYQVDPLAMQVEIYQKMAGKSRPAAANKALSESALALAERAVEADNLEAAERLLKVAAVTAGKARAADLLKQAKARGEELAAQKRETEAVRKAEAALAQDANDPAANLVLGKYLCFGQDDWEQGLPHLAKGSDAGLKELAAKCWPIPTAAAALAALGDAWWDAAEAHKGKESETLRSGAGHWYSAALPELSGIVKTKVEKRLLEISSSAGPKRSVAGKRKSNPETIELPLAPNVSLKFRLIPAGKFQMGSPATESGRAPNEEQHEVTLTKPFYMAVTETTQAQWQAVMNNNPSRHTGDAARPVEHVNWTDCEEFIARLNRSPAGRGYRFRLPTEAEWEYACRAGSTTPYAFGDDPDQLPTCAWFKGNSNDTTHPVGQLQPNAWGLYDMYGNAWEWCADWFADAYDTSSRSDPRGPATGTERCIRGGSWGNQRSVCRSATRGYKESDYKNPNIGFRLVCEPVGGFKSSQASAPVRSASTRSRGAAAIDLLKLIDPARDAPGGDWQRVPGSSALKGRGLTKLLQIPYVPPSEYSLTIGVLRRSTPTPLVVGLPVVDRRCYVIVDAPQTGLGTIDNAIANANETTRNDIHLLIDKPATVVCRVSHAGITVTFDEQKVVDYTGDYRRLGPSSFRVPNPAAIFVGTNGEGELLITRLELAPVGVETPAKAVGGSPRASVASAKPVRRGGPGPLAVAPFTADQAKEFQERWSAALGTPAAVTSSIGMKLVLVPAGEFMMGSSAEDVAAILPRYRDPTLLEGEQPQHKVQVSKPYYIGMYEVTQQEYAAVAGKNPSAYSADGKFKDLVAGADTSRFPVDFVSWNEAAAFCDRLSELPAERAAGRIYRLPTEAQWEFACRAGTTTLWSFANDATRDNNYAWWNGAANAPTHAVGTRQANSFGIFDMHGNVQEFCADWFDKSFYAQSAASDPMGPPSGQDRVTRGGSAVNSPAANRSAARLVSNPDYHYPERGFRVVCITPAMGAAKFLPPPAEGKGPKPAR